MDDPLLGAWDFQASPPAYTAGGYHSIITGTLVIGEKAEEAGGGYRCNLNAREVSYRPVTGFRWGALSETVAVQTCDVTQVGDAIFINSELVQSPSDTYRPDNFELQISGDSMTGTLVSATQYQAHFVRKGSGAALPLIEDLRDQSIFPTFDGQVDGWQRYYTGDDCISDIKTPIRHESSPYSLVVTTRNRCPGTLENGQRYDHYYESAWYVCSTKTLYVDTQTYHDASGRMIDNWRATYYGTQISARTLHQLGHQGNTLGEGTVLRVVFDRICA